MRTWLIIASLLCQGCSVIDAIDGAGANPEPVVRITAGERHTCVLLESGAVRCWGFGGAGELGTQNTDSIGDDEPASKSQAVALLEPAIRVSAGRNHTCALYDGNGTHCWGNNSAGQLGYGNTDNVGDDESPVDLPVVQTDDMPHRVNTGGMTTCTRRVGVGMRCWGENATGQLGLGHTENIGDDEHPTDGRELDFGDPVAHMAIGPANTCAVDNTGSVRCWGENATGQLGQGDLETRGDDEPAEDVPTIDVSVDPIDRIAVGARHVCAITFQGDVYCWGGNDLGQLGYGHTNTIGDDETPATAGLVPLGGPAIRIDASVTHTCAVLNDETVRCWGSNEFGQLGYKHTNPIGDDETPEAMGPVPIGEPVLKIATGRYHTCAILTETGDVKCWGRADDGQLGYGNTENIGDDETPGDTGPVPLF